MNRILITALALPLLALAAPTAASAQSPARWDLDLGIAAGPETLPAALRTLSVRPTDTALGVGAGLRLTVGRIGPFSVEGRASIHSGDTYMYVVNPNEPIGQHLLVIREESTVMPGPQAAWDLRLRFDPGEAGGVWTLGGGLMTEGVRYIAGSTGHRWRDGRIGIELDLGAYQIPWRTRTLMYEVPEEPGPFIFESYTTTYSSRWDLGLALRLVYTFDLWS